ncbi:MAG: glutamine synthetase III, partial [Bacteroidota bacterium]|nr:glutamine synthetase III [Bacteroidota bacterium]MDX5429449.1 glutamine synthetase III [Bacteroidota bacterium]MDX5468241.1 glutamine synthetase III [Bacteroidota bacterium]
MSTSAIRLKALEMAQNRAKMKVELPSDKISDYFGSQVFGDKAMKAHLSKEAYKAIKAARESGEKIDREIAEQVAAGMRQWAVSKGVTHYTHWFQPLTGTTAEKHDAFFDPISDTESVEKFTGSALVQQEPDASSFPSGGLRNTFEARGYTAWDPSSPVFIVDNKIGKTLCIPTIFVSYTGEALDYKAPLLKSLHALESAAAEVCQLFDKNVKKVQATLGIEQEYFLVDEALYNARPDLMITGRTLFGYSAAKGQQLEDHYFGSIPERIYAYMLDFETEALKLGIPLKTRHNEVAPGQFECAPNFEDINLAIDHNQLLMDIMEKIARRHGLKVLFHEKPFAGINGSGKHNNWSMGTDTGVNLLSPGNTPNKNLQFLTFFVNVIKAVHDHPDLLRASIASTENEHRLGANEAPPSIISVFIGSQLTEVLNELESNKAKKSSSGKAESILFPRIPEILLDNTDRNRTSPFAFTGNKFEFRAVGSSANSASPMIVLNSIVASQLKAFMKDLAAATKKGVKQEEAIITVLRGYVKASKKILFEGNGYSEEWKKEAEKRGLTNITEVPDALKAYLSKDVMKLFEEVGVLSSKEVHARYEILVEEYTKKIQIESRVMGDLANTTIIPSAMNFQNKLAVTAMNMKELGLKKGSYDVYLKTIEEISSYVTDLKRLVFEMVEARKRAN